MEAKELRINNYVQRIIYDFYEDNIYPTDMRDTEQVDLGILKLISEGNNDFVKGIFEPIKLTEDWLIRFGFEKIGYFNFWGERYFYKGIQIYLEDGEFRFYYQTNRAYTIYEYVHEIQNLFQILTGKELTIYESK